MKNRIIVALMLLCGTVAFAQPKGTPNGRHKDFQVIENEKIAFITEKMDLSPAEGQNFWPIYNKVEKQIKEALKEQGKAFWDLNKALKEGNYDKTLLDNYVKAKAAAAEDLHVKARPEYVKAVGEEKYARFLVAQEKFRHKQIRQLRQPGPGRPGQPGQPMDSTAHHHHGPKVK